LSLGVLLSRTQGFFNFSHGKLSSCLSFLSLQFKPLFFKNTIPNETKE